MQTARNPTFWLTALASFLFGFLFIAVCYVGFPVDFTADHVSNIRDTAAFSYGQLVKLVLNPTTPAWFYPPGDGSMAYLRPLHFFLMKLYFNWFDYSLPPFHVTAAVGNGLVGLILFLFIHHWTRSLVLGFLGIVFYSSLPSNYFAMSSTFSMDFQHFIGLMTLLSLSLFWRLTLKEHKTPWVFLLHLLGWIAVTWLVIKLKSSEKIVPVVCGAFLVVRWKFISERIGKGKTAMVLFMTLAMAVLVVPLKSFEAWTGKESLKTEDLTIGPSTEKDKAAFSFHWENVLQRAFFVPGGKFPLTTLSRSDTPRSFSENFGFFLSWFFWLNLMGMPILISRYARAQVAEEEIERRESFFHSLTLFLIWFLTSLVGFSSGLSVFDTRFLNFAYLPSMFLLFLFLVLDRHLIFLNSKSRRAFTAVMAFLILYSSLSNDCILAGLLSHFGGMQSAVVRAETDVYREVFGEEPTSTSLYERHLELEGKATLIDWYDHGKDWFPSAEARFKRETTLYFFCQKAESFRLEQFRRAGYTVVPWQRYELLDAEAAIFTFFKWAMSLKNVLRRKAKPPPKILIYKITSPKI